MDKALRNYIQRLDTKTIQRYNTRFDKLGVNAKTLGWGSTQDQYTRFGAATYYVDFSHRTVLDVGCGFADFLDFLSKKKIGIKKYKGIDINKNLLRVAEKKYPQAVFRLRNILLNNYKKPQADIVTLFGILNFRLHGVTNIAYTKAMLDAAWMATKEVLVVDFLSDYRTKDYKKESFVYYHKPRQVLDYCFKLSNNIVLVHDYQPIPQKEFMVIMRKEFRR